MSSNRLVLIDPNKVNDTNSGILRPEDLFINVDLIAYKKPRSLIYNNTAINNPSTTRNIIGFFKGTNINGTNFLTTNYTRYESNIYDNNNTNLNESFGITNIKIDFNASFTPLITISFVDVRGSTLFESGNNSIYNIFFNLPYPIFELKVKGYLGYQVSYCLHLLKFNSRFDSSTGNFEITCEFIGYTFAFLSDMLLGYLRAAVETPKGKELYKQKLSKINKNLPTINELLYKLSFYNSELKNQADINLINEYKSITKVIELYDTANSIFNENMTKISSLNSSITTSNYEINNINITYLSNVNNIVDQISNQFEFYNKNIKNGKFQFPTNSKQNLYGENDNFFIKKNTISNNNNFNINYEKFNDFYNKRLQELQNLSIEYKRQVSEIIKNNVITKINFEPTIKNIITIFTLHAEVLMELIEDISKEAEQQDNNIRKNCFKSSELKNSNNKINPWPTYINQDSVEDWIGEILTKDIPETRLVKEILNGLLSIYSMDELLNEYLLNPSSTSNFYFSLFEIYLDSSNPYINIFNDSDYFINSFQNIDNKLWTIILTRLFNLSTNNIGFNSKLLFENTYKIYGEIEANYLITAIDTLPDATKSQIIGYFTRLIFKSNNEIIKDLFNNIIFIKKTYFFKTDEFLTNDLIHYKRISDNNSIHNYLITTYKYSKIKDFYDNSNGNSTLKNANNISEVLNNKSDIYYICSNYNLSKTNNNFKYFEFIDNIIFKDSFELNEEYFEYLTNEEKEYYKSRRLRFLSENELVDNKSNTLYSRTGINDFTKITGDENEIQNIKSSRDLLLSSKSIIQFYDILRFAYYNKNLGLTSISQFYLDEIGLYYYDNRKNDINFNVVIHYLPFDIYNNSTHINFITSGNLYDSILDNSLLSLFETKSNKISKSYYFLGHYQNNIKYYLVDNYRNEINKKNFIQFQPTLCTFSKKHLQLFTSELYLYQFSDNNIEKSNFRRSYLFLSLLPLSINFVFNYNYYYIKKILNLFNKPNLKYLPKLFILWLGSKYYFHDNKTSIKIIWEKVDNSITKSLIPNLNKFPEPNQLETDDSPNGSFYTTKITPFQTNKYIENPFFDVPISFRNYCKNEYINWVKCKEDYYDNIPSWNDKIPSWNKIRKCYEIYNFDDYTNFQDIKNKWINDWNDFKNLLSDDSSQVQISIFLKNKYNFVTDITATTINSSNSKYISLRPHNDTGNYDYFSMLNPYLKEVHDIYWDCLSAKNKMIQFVGFNLKYDGNSYITDSNQLTELNITQPIIREKHFNDYINSFITKIRNWINDVETTNNRKDNAKMSLFGTTENKYILLNIYRQLSAIYTKWISGDLTTIPCVFLKKNESLIDRFIFIDRSYSNIGDKLIINPFNIRNWCINNLDQSLYNLIGNKILANNNIDFIALPTFINFRDKEELKNMFKPMISDTPTVKGPSFVCVYIGQRSQYLDIDIENINNNDGIDFSSSNIPSDFYNENDTEFNLLPVFMVNYGDQNQSIFKNINLDQAEFSETDESLTVINQLTTDKKTFIGQNLFNIYSIRSYSAEIEMLGNFTIQPFMYFQLNSIPMFRGGYMIIKVSHNIVPNHATTTFKGVRIKRAKLPLVDSEFIYLSILDEIFKEEFKPIQFRNIQELHSDIQINGNVDRTVTEAINAQNKAKQILNHFNGTKFSLPYDNNIMANVSSSLGLRNDRLHTGIDINLNEGTDLYPIFDGTVLWIYNEPKGYGLNIAIAHEYNKVKFVSLYAHLSDISDKIKGLLDLDLDKLPSSIDNNKLVINKSIIVKTNDIIGKSGGNPIDTKFCGHSSGAHLHLEIRKVSDFKVNNYFKTDNLIDPQIILYNS